MDKERGIRASVNGPWVMPGEIRILVDGATPPGKPQTAVALCRCGGSSDKPVALVGPVAERLVGPEVVLHLG